MAILHYRDPNTQEWVSISNIAGPPGPTAVSADIGNAAVLGSDKLIFVPTSMSGAVAMDDLTDADTVTTAPTGGDALVWDDPYWVPGRPSPLSPNSPPPSDPGDTIVWVPNLDGPGQGGWVAAPLGLNDLSDADTSLTPAALGNVLVWDTFNWVPGTASLLDPMAPPPSDGDTIIWESNAPTGPAGWVPVPGVEVLDDLDDVDTALAATGNALVWDGAASWVPGVASPLAPGSPPPSDGESIIWNPDANGSGQGGWIPGSAGVTDHGALTGLTNLDHPQYAAWTIGATAPAVPVAGHLWLVTP